MEEGLYQKSRIPDDAWFFLKTVVMARDGEGLAFKEKRMPGIYESTGSIDVPEIGEKAMDAKAQEHGLRGWPDYQGIRRLVRQGRVSQRHVCGDFQMYPLNVLKRDVRSR
jgi:hypothetical protein